MYRLSAGLTCTGADHAGPERLLDADEAPGADTQHGRQEGSRGNCQPTHPRSGDQLRFNRVVVALGTDVRICKIRHHRMVWMTAYTVFSAAWSLDLMI